MTDILNYRQNDALIEEWNGWTDKQKDGRTDTQTSNFNSLAALLSFKKTFFPSQISHIP